MLLRVPGVSSWKKSSNQRGRRLKDKVISQRISARFSLVEKSISWGQTRSKKDEGSSEVKRVCEIWLVPVKWDKDLD